MELGVTTESARVGGILVTYVTPMEAGGRLRDQVEEKQK
jgi:hypothetical protein